MKEKIKFLTVGAIIRSEDKMKKSREIGGTSLEIVKGDITSQKTDAVVNAANKRLAPGGGVAGAIHDAAGPELYEECKKHGSCKTGEAVITDAYELPAHKVIHTVGPVYSGEEEDEKKLRESYRDSLKLAVDEGLKSISFPALSTGAFGYPPEDAAEIAFDEISRFLKKHDDLDLVRMVLYSEEDFKIHEEKLKEFIES